MKLPLIASAHRRQLPSGFEAIQVNLGGLVPGEICVVTSNDALASSKVCRRFARACYDDGFQVVHDPGPRGGGVQESDYVRVSIAGANAEEVFGRVREARRAEPGTRLVVLERMGRMRGSDARNIEELKSFVREAGLVAVVSFDEWPVAPSVPSDLFITVKTDGGNGDGQVSVLHPGRTVAFTFSLATEDEPLGTRLRASMQTTAPPFAEE